MALIAGNWKMYKNVDEAKSFVENLLAKIGKTEDQVFLAVPFTVIAACSELAKDSTVLQIGAQNMNDCEEGAFTGEVAASMIKDVGATFSLLGHSERRHLF